MPPERVCSICQGTYVGFGDSAFPVNDGRCCRQCNQTVVVPARIDLIRSALSVVTIARHGAEPHDHPIFKYEAAGLSAIDHKYSVWKSTLDSTPRRSKFDASHSSACLRPTS
jgi:hypothetical protein